LQPLQALLDRRHHPLTAAVAAVGHFVVAHPELGDHNDLPAVSPERPRQCLLGDAHPIGFRGIEAVDAAVDCSLYCALELPFVDLPVRAADLPAAKADRRDL
jgi:hypothetical protein